MNCKKSVAVVSAIVMCLSAAVTVSADEWKKTDSGYVYEYDDGTIAENGWLTVGKDKYYIGKDGTRHTGWLKTTSSRYYFGEDGKMYKSRWIKFANGTKYYARSNGKIATGKIKISGKTYEFDDSGKLIEKSAETKREIPKKTYKFVLNTETKCLHTNENCRAAIKIDSENYDTITISENELSSYSEKGYWCCGVRGCNSPELRKAMPKPEED